MLQITAIDWQHENGPQQQCVCEGRSGLTSESGQGEILAKSHSPAYMPHLGQEETFLQKICLDFTSTVMWKENQNDFRNYFQNTNSNRNKETKTETQGKETQGKEVEQQFEKEPKPAIARERWNSEEDSVKRRATPKGTVWICLCIKLVVLAGAINLYNICSYFCT